MHAKSQKGRSRCCRRRRPKCPLTFPCLPPLSEHTQGALCTACAPFKPLLQASDADGMENTAASNPAARQPAAVKQSQQAAPPAVLPLAIQDAHARPACKQP